MGEGPSAVELIEQIPLGLVVWRFDDLNDPATMRMVAINEAAARIGKITAHEAVGRPFIHISPGLFESGLPRIYAEVARSGQPRIIENLLYSDDRVEPAYFRIHVFPLAHAHVGIAFEDVTPRKQAEDTVTQIVEALAPISGDDFFRELVPRLGQACQGGRRADRMA